MANITNVIAIQTAIEFLAGTDFPTEYPEVFAKLQHIDEVNRKGRKGSSITPTVIADTERWVLDQEIAQTASQVANHFGWTVQRASMTLRATGLSSESCNTGKSKVKIYGNEEQLAAAQEHYVAVCQAQAAERAAKASAR